MDNPDIEILVGGMPIKKYYDTMALTNSGPNTFVEGRPNTIYSIRITNRFRDKRLYIISVDGINVVTHDRTWIKGYVLRENSVETIKDWHSSRAPLIFQDTRRASSFGVIGIKCFSLSSNTHKEVFRTQPDWTSIIYYDDARGLEKRGIFINKINDLPKAF